MILIHSLHNVTSINAMNAGLSSVLIKGGTSLFLLRYTCKGTFSEIFPAHLADVNTVVTDFVVAAELM